MEVLKDYEIVEDKQNLSLTIMADDGVEQLASILNLIQKNGITVANFTQKLPTLEDVFFELINEKTTNKKEVPLKKINGEEAA
jgi:ABC-2 type transport system ATP-binding protein